MLQTVTSQSAPSQTQIQNNMVVSERSTVEEVSFEWSVWVYSSALKLRTTSHVSVIHSGGEIFWLWRKLQYLFQWFGFEFFVSCLTIRFVPLCFIVFFFHRGVLQALIKKQFPAPDRKVADLFGIDDFDSGMPGRSSPAPGQRTPKKRKKPGQ